MTLPQVTSDREREKFTENSEGNVSINVVLDTEQVSQIVNASHEAKTYTWVIKNPEVGGIPGPRLKGTHTVTRVDSYTAAATSVSFNIEERSVIGTPGVDILTVDQVADVDGTSIEEFANAAVATDNWIWLDISAVDGLPEYLTVTLTATT
jgi:hypothetical protein